MNGVLIIGPDDTARITAAIARARAKPVPLEVLRPHLDGTAPPILLLKDRKSDPKEFRKKYHPENVILGTYRCAISFEHQPAGLMRHLSASTYRHDKLPSINVMKMICQAFGFSQFPPLQSVGRVWLEEFEPRCMAVNVIELVQSIVETVGIIT